MALALVLAPLLVLTPGCGPDAAPGSGAEGASAPDRILLGGTCMGTSWSAVVLPDVPETSPEQLQTLIQAELDSVDEALSTWKTTSDLSRLAAAPPLTPVPVSPVTLDVLRLADRWVARTGGAFDPTVGPLVALWGFSTYEQVPEPTEEAIEAARSRVGWDRIQLQEGAVMRLAEGVQLDASAIAKGHAVDLAAAALEGAGHNNFLLEVGGETVVRGERPGGGKWRMGIESPLAPAGAEPGSPMGLAHHPHLARILVTDIAVATSGDYRNVRTVDGRTVTHALDPRSGLPVDHDLASVTVIAGTCADADALATAALVLGPDAGLELLESIEGVEAVLLTRTGDSEKPLAYDQTSGMHAFEVQWWADAPVKRQR